jgi:hypothetical protein
MPAPGNMRRSWSGPRGGVRAGRRSPGPGRRRGAASGALPLEDAWLEAASFSVEAIDLPALPVRETTGPPLAVSGTNGWAPGG